VLQDKYLPSFHFSERHRILVSASPASISKQLYTLDASESWIVKILLMLRGIPSTTATGMEGWKKMGFVLLEHQPGKEIVLGLVGQFWKSQGNIQPITANEFGAFNQEGFVKATWNFEIMPASGNSVILETETRIYCTNENVRKKFGRYWFFIKPFSGLIRKEMLKIIKRKAERDS
jgi:hypothetical protein